MSTLNTPQHINIPDDCLHLHKAFQGFGCNANTIISILAHRTYPQRNEIKTIYQMSYGEDLCTRIKSELHLNFERAMLQWMRDRTERDAITLREAVTSTRSRAIRSRIVAEAFCLRTAQELQSIAHVYFLKFKRDLASDLKDSTTTFCTKLCDRYLNGPKKNPSREFNAQAEAKALNTAGENGSTLDENVFLETLTTRNIRELCAIFEAYEKIYKHEVHKGLKKWEHKASEESAELLVSIIKYIHHPTKYFAKVLHDALKGFLADEDAIIRVVANRAEIDMKNIKEEFVKKYKTPLENMISSKTHNKNFKKFVLEVIGV